MASGTTNDGDDLAPGLVLDPLDVLEPDDALDLSLRRAVWKNDTRNGYWLLGIQTDI